MEDILIDTAQHALHLSFKGDRDYLHGSDIVPALLALTGSVRRVQFQFHRLARESLAARWVQAGELAALRSSRQLVALMSYHDRQDRPHWIAVVPCEAPRAIGRKPYDEAAVTVQARFEGSRVSDGIAGGPPSVHGFTERVLALNKLLLDRCAGRGSSQRWLFSRLDLIAAPLQPPQLTLDFDRAVSADMFRTRLTSDGRSLGTLYFTRSAA